MGSNSANIPFEKILNQTIKAIRQLLVNSEHNHICSRLRYFFELNNGTWFEIHYHSPWASCLSIETVDLVALHKARNANGLANMIGRTITDIVKSEDWVTFGIILEHDIVLNIDEEDFTERIFIRTLDGQDIPEDLTSWITGSKLSTASSS